MSSLAAIPLGFGQQRDRWDPSALAVPVSRADSPARRISGVMPRFRGHDANRLASASRMPPAASVAEREAEQLRAALDGDEQAVQAFVLMVLPVVQARVARALCRRSESRGRDVQQEVADFTQEVFVSLLTNDKKALRAWDPARGLSLRNFVGLLAERRVAATMRIKRRGVWSEAPATDVIEEVERSPDVGPDSRVASSELLERLFSRLQTQLSPRGLELFYRLYVDEQSVEDVCSQTGLSSAAVYQWRSRLGDTARTTLNALQTEDGPATSPRSKS